MTYSNQWNRLIYGWWAPIYDAFIRFHPAANDRKKAFELIKPVTGDFLLLAGVGTGIDLEFIDPATNVLGIDLSPRMLARAIAKAERLERDFQAVCGDVSTMPFGDSEFDIVVLTLIVSVVPDARQCLREALRVTKPNGHLLVMDKFLAEGKSASLLRRGFNLLTRFFGTDINRSWEQMSMDLPFTLIAEHRSMNGSFRTLVLRK